MRQYRLQKRQHPIFSPLALLSTFILACGLIGWVVVAGGRAFSPGDLSAVNHSGQQPGGFMSHANFDGACNKCHAPFKGVEAQRCEQCHKNIAQQRQTGVGLHSRINRVERCAACHQEHKGQDFDQLEAALVSFDHNITDFSLAKHLLDYQNLPLECPACHVTTGGFRLAANACIDCHQQAAPEFMATHTEAFGETCLDCHDGHDTMAGFTLQAHANVFPLEGIHATTPCEQCHAGGQFEDIATECVACHAEPEIHAGMFGEDCATCHRPEGWLPAMLNDRSFDHTQDTRFSLVTHVTNFDGAAFTCRTCHTDSQPVSFTDGQCIDCHGPANPVFINDHLAQFGETCMNCHNGTGELTHFDHNQLWPLEGQHATLTCESCHIDKLFRGTPRDCVGCHAEPAIHAGLFGVNCAACHTAQAWQPAQLTQHTFPLNHGEQGELDCATCHPSTYTQYTCYNCHEHNPSETERQHREEGIGQQQLPNCAQCHPTGREHEN